MALCHFTLSCSSPNFHMNQSEREANAATLSLSHKHNLCRYRENIQHKITKNGLATILKDNIICRNIVFKRLFKKKNT